MPQKVVGAEWTAASMAQHGPQGVVTGTADNVHEIGRGPDAPLRVLREKGAVGPCSQQILYYKDIRGKSGGGEGS